MNTVIRIARQYDIQALLSIWGLVLAAISTTVVRQANADSAPLPPSGVVAVVASDKTELGVAIASQGNAALLEIRAETSRLAMPALPPPTHR
jgi:hypothetical protein